MDATQIKAACVRISEILRKPSETEVDAKEVGELALNLLEDFLLDHKRQTELLETIARIADDEQAARLRGER